jgi:hypothetical protein
VNRFAEQIYGLGWRGRPSGGMDKRWGVVPILVEELKPAEGRGPEGDMIYQPNSTTRDLVGRPGDKESLEGLLQAFGDTLGELRRR